MSRQHNDPTWYPFTQMKEYLDHSPLEIAGGEGNWLIDVNGRRYLDGVSSLWANIHGHRVPEIDSAIREQLDRIAHSTLLGLSHPQAVELSRRLVNVVPEGLSRVFYSDAGATAVEIALKIAFQYKQLIGEKDRKGFIHLSESYHGDTVGAVSVGGIDIFHQIFGPLLFDTVSIPTPHFYRHPDFDGDYEAWKQRRFDETEKIIADNADKCCAVIVEPLMQGAGGMLKMPEGYLKHLREVTHKHGLLLIVDEVATGFGRTGKLFACEHEGVTPDLMCMGKGITGGYMPLAATLATEEVFSAFLGDPKDCKTFFHGHTYTGNPLACAAALASLDLFEDNKIIENLGPKLERYAAGMAKLGEMPCVGDLRFRGMMGGVELVKDKATSEPFPASERIGNKVIMAARELGLMVRPLDDLIVLLPPLSITEEELDFLFEKTGEAIAKVCL